MPDHIPIAYGLWSGLLSLIGLQFLWIHFIAYPAYYERMLRRGRNWMYVPLRWKGFYKIQILFISRLFVVGIAILIVALIVHYTGNKKPFWVAAFGIAAYVAAAWAASFWPLLRYRQQEDVYYLHLDELRAKLELENKDYSEAQIRSLAAYQHQQKLLRADEEGKFLAVLRDETRQFRKAKAALTSVSEA